MRIIHSTSTIEDFISSFTGREGFPGYDPSKPISLSELQRACVWTVDMMILFIINILEGFPSPGIVICNNGIVDGGNRSTSEKQFMLGNFKISLGAFNGTYSDLRSDATHPSPVGDAPPIPYTTSYIRDRSLFRSRWDKHQIPVTTITGATDDEKADIYDRYNRGIVMTLGQHLDARTHYPIVSMALAMIGHSRNVVFPFAELYHRVFQQSWKKTKGRRELAFAFQVLVASAFGRERFHTKFTEHLDLIKNTSKDQIDLSNLCRLCEIIDSADPHRTAAKNKKRKAFKKFIPAMIYDLGGGMSIEVLTTKWRQFFVDAYNTLTKEQLKALVDVGTARAKTFGRIGAVSVKVQEYLDTRMNPTADDDAVENDDDSDDESD